MWIPELNRHLWGDLLDLWQTSDAHRQRWLRNPPPCMGATETAIATPKDLRQLASTDRPAGSVFVPSVVFDAPINQDVPKPPTRVNIYPMQPLCTRFRRKHDVAIVTLAHNQEGLNWLTISGPLLEQYARRCQADLIVIRGQTQSYIHAEKFRAQLVLTQKEYRHDRMLFIDADALVHPDADCLFDVVPSGHVAMRQEGHLYKDDWYERETRLLLETQGIDWPADKPLPIGHNTGVYLLDREHADCLTPHSRPIPGNWCDEQSWINFRVHQLGCPIYKLSEKQHWLWYFDRDRVPLDGVQIVHYAGAKVSAGLNKADLMREQVKAWGLR